MGAVNQTRYEAEVEAQEPYASSYRGAIYMFDAESDHDARIMVERQAIRHTPAIIKYIRRDGVNILERGNK